jgi:hypothetical protein
MSTLEEIPDSVRLYLCQQLGLPVDTKWGVDTQISRYRHRLAIRAYLNVISYWGLCSRRTSMRRST